MKLVAYIRYDEAVAWYMGFVREIELRTQVAVIPLNLVMSWWFWLLQGVRWRWTSGPKRFRRGRRALAQAVERGRRAGFNQGKVDEYLHPRSK